MKEIMEVARYIRKELKTADEYAYEANKHKENSIQRWHSTTIVLLRSI